MWPHTVGVGGEALPRTLERPELLRPMRLQPQEGRHAPAALSCPAGSGKLQQQPEASTMGPLPSPDTNYFPSKV